MGQKFILSKSDNLSIYQAIGIVRGGGLRMNRKECGLVDADWPKKELNPSPKQEQRKTRNKQN